MKVKFFSDVDLVRLEETVNDFIKTREFVDIKLTESSDDWSCVVIYRGSPSDNNSQFTQKTPKNN